MKIFTILRGFPGLGRVIAGVEIVQALKTQYNAKVNIVTYLQGAEYLKTQGINSILDINEHDISSIGIIPVSIGGEAIIREIEVFLPDLIILDGEPLLLKSIKLNFPDIKLVSLLNPFDINNPHNQKSSRLFFLDLYKYADLSIVHGLWNEKKPKSFNNFKSINSIVRNSIQKIKYNNDSTNIVCLLGGGAKSVNSGFFNSTIEIAKQVLDISRRYPMYTFEVYTSDSNIKKQLFHFINNKSIVYHNVKIYSDIVNEYILYNNARVVIARAGRNTISELLQINMPSIIIPTTSNFRGSEQLENCKFVESSKYNNMTVHYLDEGSGSLNKIFLKLLNVRKTDSSFFAGNKEAIESIIELL